ncbi:MAG: hypothetical protein AABN33_29400 [Acidobacteriota bacterium]
MEKWTDQLLPPFARRHPRWATAIAVFGFLLYQLPLQISSAWPAWIKDKTIPAWWAEKKPAMSTGLYDWLVIGLYIIPALALGVFVVLIWRATRKLPALSPPLPEPQLLEDSPGQLQIISAQYGIGEKWNDAAPKLKSMISDGRLILADQDYNDLFPPDPKKHVKKKLIIEYSYIGQRFSETTTENAVLVLPSKQALLAASEHSVRSENLAKTEAEDRAKFLYTEIRVSIKKLSQGYVEFTFLVFNGTRSLLLAEKTIDGYLSLEHPKTHEPIRLDRPLVQAQTDDTEPGRYTAITLRQQIVKEIEVLIDTLSLPAAGQVTFSLLDLVIRLRFDDGERIILPLCDAITCTSGIAVGRVVSGAMGGTLPMVGTLH